MVAYRSKDTLKCEILRLLRDSKKGEIISLDEMKQTLRITTTEADSFSRAVRELEDAKEITMHITVSLSTL